MDPVKSLSLNVRRILEQRFLSLAEAARQVGVSYTTMRRIAVEQRATSVEILHQLAETFDTTPNQLLGWEPMTLQSENLARDTVASGEKPA